MVKNITSGRTDSGMLSISTSTVPLSRHKFILGRACNGFGVANDLTRKSVTNVAYIQRH